ncbi:aldo/keto reductase [Candidatus Latescibacterota bacterium]
MRRRTFLASAAAAGAAGAIDSGAADFSDTVMPRRPYGKTGISLSVVGLGGMVLKDTEQAHANAIVKDAVDAGINYFDVAPTYGDSEQRLGPALEPYRDGVFLACKSTQRTKEELNEELSRSLDRLRTDHFDLYQLHAITTAQDIATAFGRGGALEAVLEAREKGIVRNIGFSAHSVEAAMEALELFAFDSILVPVNFVTWYHGKFGPQLVEYARDRGAAILALKSMALTRIPRGQERPYANCWYVPVEDEEMASLALRFTLSLPVTAAVPPGDEGLWRTAVKMASRFLPLSDSEQERLRTVAMETEPLFGYPSGQFNLVEKNG